MVYICSYLQNVKGFLVNKLLRNGKLYRECIAEDATCSSDIDIISPKKIWRTCSSTSMVWVCIDLSYSRIAFYLSHFWTKTAFWMFLPIHSFGMVLSLDLFDWIVIDTYLCKIVGTQVARHQMFSMLWLKSTNMTLSSQLLSWVVHCCPIWPPTKWQLVWDLRVSRIDWSRAWPAVRGV